jgi:outer membrane biosynthesis protein TonB
MRWIAVLAMLVWSVSARAEPPDAEREAPPVGGLFGLFGRSQTKKKPTAVEPAPPPVIATEVPAVAPTEPPSVAPTPPPPTRAPTIAPEPTETSPVPTPTAARRQRKGAKAEPTVTPTPTETPEEGAEEEGAVEAPPEKWPTTAEEGAAREAPPEAVAPPGEAETGRVPEKREASRGSGGKSDVQLPSVEIQGELEKPDIFFVLPRARDQSDEQLMRARIRREITRPVIKDWIEEEMLLK